MSTTTSSALRTVSTAAPTWVQRHPLVVYFAIAFVGTWAVVIPLMLSATYNLFALPDAISFLLYFFAPYVGPMLAAIFVTRALEGGAGVKNLLKRIFQWRVGARWYLAAFFSMLFIWLAAYSIVYSGAPLRALISNPMLMVSPFLTNILIGILIPSLGEEVGWRGFALPHLQGKYGPVVASLILGLLHGLWHLPALLTPFMGPLTPGEILPFVLTALAGTFVYTWVVNNARGSILIAILLHASSNAASGLMNEIVPKDVVFSAPMQMFLDGWFNVLIFGLAAIVLVVLTRGRLGYQPAAAAGGMPGRNAGQNTAQPVNAQ